MELITLNAIVFAQTASALPSQISGITTRIYEIVASISAVIIAILWIPIAISFFGADENKRYEAKARMRNAIIGTFIYVLAVSGVLYAVISFIITGS